MGYCLIPLVRFIRPGDVGGSCPTVPSSRPVVNHRVVRPVDSAVSSFGTEDRDAGYKGRSICRLSWSSSHPIGRPTTSTDRDETEGGSTDLVGSSLRR